MNLQISGIRLRNVEFKWCDANKKYELIKWHQHEKDQALAYCCVIAFFDETKEGYDMRTVGERFFEDDKDIYLLAKHSLAFLNAMFQELKKD